MGLKQLRNHDLHDESAGLVIRQCSLCQTSWILLAGEIVYFVDRDLDYAVLWEFSALREMIFHLSLLVCPRAGYLDSCFNFVCFCFFVSRSLFKPSICYGTPSRRGRYLRYIRQLERQVAGVFILGC